jgi:hypothetical protein
MTTLREQKDVKGMKDVKGTRIMGEMKHATMARLLLGAAIALAPTWLLAEQGRQGAKPAPVDLATARPGRDPNQPIDEEYTKKIKEYTTETFFLSPVIDYMPASKTVPTPKVILGDIAGAPGKLPYTKDVQGLHDRHVGRGP